MADWQKMVASFSQDSADLNRGVSPKKIIITGLDKLKFVYEKESNRVVHYFNLEKIRHSEGIKYTNVSSQPLILLNCYDEEDWSSGESVIISSMFFIFLSRFRNQSQITVNHGDSFPEYKILADGEAEGDEPVTLNISLFTEPDWLWGDIMSRRLSVLARRFVNGTDKAWLDIKTKSRNYASDLITDERTLKQYNNCMNAFKSCIGHTWKLVKDVESTTLEASKKPDRDDVETLIGKLETALPHNETVEDFFHQNSTDEWWDAHQLRRIHLPRIHEGEKGLGELLYDINKDHTHPTNGLNPTNAEKDWDLCVRRCFNMAWESLKRILRTEIAYSYGWGDSALTFPKNQPEPT